MSATGQLAVDTSTGVWGGLLHWESSRPVAAESLLAMAGRISAGPARVEVGSAQIGVFDAGGRHVLETGPQAWVVGDLDLTNLDALRAVAGGSGSDEHLLGTLYGIEGPGFVRRLRGAFAFALWDPRQRRLLLATDQLGIRRLYYASDGRTTAFSTRVGAVLAAPGVEKRVDAAVVYQYLNFGFVPAPATPFVGVQRLAPGHVFLAEGGRGRLEPYWDMTYPERPVRRRVAAAEVYRLSADAVGAALNRLPVKQCGAFLSGGTDSSTIVGLMSRLTGERVNAFSIGFDDEAYNELHYASLAARHFGASHYTCVITAKEAIEAMPRLVGAYEEPLGNNSAIGTLLCAKLARECGVSHLLAGDGGDEIFGGNERYRDDQIFARYHRLPGLLRRGVLEPILRRLPEEAPGPLGKAQRYVRRANLPNPGRFYSYEFFVADNRASLLDPEFIRRASAGDPLKVIEGHFGRIQARSELNRLMYLDLKLTIGDNDLFKVTRTAEVGGVAVRFPFLSLPLVEYTGTLPIAFKVRGLEKRHLFKRAFRDLLPAEILGKQKHGFGVPTSAWLRTDPAFRSLARETLLSGRAEQRGYFAPGAIRRLITLHEGEPTPFYGDLVWSFLMLELWHRRHVDDAGAAA